MRYAALIGALVIGLLFIAACRGVESTPTATTTQDLPGPGAQVQQVPPPTATPSPKLPGSITPAPASESFRLDLGGGVVVAFVEGLSPKFSGKVAYVTHVPTGSQLVLDPEGEIIDRHDGRDDGPDLLDAVLADQATVDRIVEGLQGDDDLRPRETIADWLHSIQFGGITYLAKGSLGEPIITKGERALTIEDLGSEIYRVAFRIEGYSGSHQDGDATYLNPGTPIHAVKGYSPEFRLAALEDGTPRLFEADTHPEAESGEALLDIRGKVTSIDVLSTTNSIKVLGTKVENGEDVVLGKIEEERAVKRFVELVLESPIDQGRRDHEGPRYFLYFRLADGTSVVRAFWLESGEISRGIMTDPAATLSVWRALGEDNRPLATNGGPRISERLAARLGLAYLSLAVPEIDVTGKPHSPVVRLMRRSEFEAMRGSAPAMPSDPLVWVVEAQGSWRTGGITPEEARQDLSVALVAFDADTGSQYGASYGNTSLPATHNDAPLITPTPTPMPTPERDRHEEPPRGPGVEIGTGYPYTLYVHCGIRDARFDGRLWMADPMLSDGSGNPPLDWAAADSRGKMKLVRDDLAVFTAESGRIIEFKPWPLDVEWRPCF